jgi:hypothetical protein
LIFASIWVFLFDFIGSFENQLSANAVHFPYANLAENFLKSNYACGEYDLV